MDKKKLPTINLKGKEYVQVKDRVLFFNEEYPDGRIRTEVITSGNMATFKAEVTPDCNGLANRYFTGHAFGAIEEVKAFEKLESVAVGRALAFMGIGVLESIASADEMDRFHSKPSINESKQPVEGGKNPYWKYWGKNQEGQDMVSGSKKQGGEWYARIEDGERKYYKTKDEWLADIVISGENPASNLPF